MEDLLDPHVLHARVGEAAQVAGGVGETVGMIHPQAVDDALAHELEDLRVGDGEDLRVLDPHGREVVDVEEAPVPAVSRVAVEEPRAQRLVGPPAVLVRDAHVVRDDVEHDRQAGGPERPQARLAPERVRDARRVDDVVAVRRAGPRLQRRREVQVRDAEVAQVRDELRDGGEVELGVSCSR